jgi:hypothetical protein
MTTGAEPLHGSLASTLVPLLLLIAAFMAPAVVATFVRPLACRWRLLHKGIRPTTRIQLDGTVLIVEALGATHTRLLRHDGVVVLTPHCLVLQKAVLTRPRFPDG